MKTITRQMPMGTVTAEQRKSLEQAEGEMVNVSDPETNQDYVVVRAEVFEPLRSCHGDLNPRELYPALHRALEDEGWDDPQMVLLT
jgi:hypothetical protein